MAPAVFVSVVLRLMMVLRVMIGMIHAKEVANAIANRGGTLARCVVTMGIRLGVGMRMVGMRGLGIVGEMMSRVGGVAMGGA